MGKCISTAEKLGKELRDSYERWNHILQNGAGDPFWGRWFEYEPGT